MIGADSQNTIDSYQWTKDGKVLQNETTETFCSVLKLSDAGRYTCEVTVDGVVYNSSNVENVYIASKL